MKTKIFTLLTALLLAISAYAGDVIVFSTYMNDAVFNTGESGQVSFTIKATGGTFTVDWGNSTNIDTFNGSPTGTTCMKSYSSRDPRTITISGDVACAITGFECTFQHKVYYIDVTQAPHLKELTACGGLNALDLRSNPDLTYLNCSTGNLTSLDLSSNGALTYLDCSKHPLTAIASTAGLVDLETFNCSRTQLTSLPALAGKLKYLTCTENQFSSMNLSGKTSLVNVDCSNGTLTNLSASGCPNLYKFNCASNQLTSLDLSNSNVSMLTCTYNQLTSLNISNSNISSYLDCSNNKLTTLDFSNVNAGGQAMDLYCTNNEITHITVGTNTNFSVASCGSNHIPLSNAYTVYQKVAPGGTAYFANQTLPTQQVSGTVNLTGEMVINGIQTAFTVLRDGNPATAGVDYQLNYTNQTITFFVPATYKVTMTNAAIPTASVDVIYIVDNAACGNPTNITASNITGYGATLSWNASVSSPSGGYQYEVRASGAVGSGTTGLIASGNTPAGVTSIAVSGLSCNTVYTVYVRSNCGGGSYSRWSNGYSFTTDASIITTYPYIQSFGSVLSDCWSASEEKSGSNYHWQTTIADANYGASASPAGDYFAYLNVSYASSTYNPYYLKTPPFVLDNVPKEVSYYYFLGNSGNTTTPVPLSLQISADGGATWADLYQHTTANSTFATTNAVSNWKRNTVDLSAYVNQTVIFRFAANAKYGSGYCNQGIDEFTIENISGCTDPSSLIVSNITALSVKVAWTAPDPAPTNGYQYEVRSSGGAGSGVTGLAASGNVPAGTVNATISGLLPSTAYVVYVRSDCGGEYSRWSQGAAFKTVIGSYPYLQSFSSVLDKDWTASEGGYEVASYHWKTTTADAGYGVNGPKAGSYFAYLYVRYAGDLSNPYYLNTPAFTLDNVPMQVSYYYYLGAAGYTASPVPLSLQISTDNGATWTTIYQHTTANSKFATTGDVSNWMKNTVDLTAYANQTVKLRFASNSNNYGWGVAVCDQGIDEFVLEDIPSCVEPRGLTVSNVTATTALISWNASSSNPANGYQYEVRTYGEPGSGTDGLAASGNIAAGSTNLTLSGLTGSINYMVYLRSDCGGGDYSPWTDGVPLLTAVGNYPYIQPFAYTLDNNWTYSEGVLGSSIHWNTTNADASYGVSGPKAGSYFARLNVYSANSTYMPFYLNAPSFTLDNTPKQVSYFYYLGSAGFTGTSNAPLTLQISVNNGASWTNLYQHSTANTTFATSNDLSNWKKNTVDLSAYANKTVMLRFASSSYNFGGGFCNQGIDEFTVENIPSCIEPRSLTVTNVTATTALFSWNASPSNPANGYQYEVRTYGDPGSGANGLAVSGTSPAGTTSATISGLPMGALCFVYIRSDCGGGDYSTWSNAASFTTLCSNVTTFPYVQSFNAVLDGCWSVSEGASGSSVHWQTTTADASHGASAPKAGSYFAYLNVYSAQTTYNPYYLTSPQIVLDNTPKCINYYYYLGNNGYKNSPVPPALQISVDNGATWTDLYQHTDANSVFSTTSAVGNWTKNTVDLSAYVNKTIKLRFASNSNRGSGYCNQGIDEFTIENIPSCAEPTSVIATQITDFSALVSWSASLSNPAGGYQYEVRTSGAAGSGTSGLAASGNTSAGVLNATVSGLSGSTDYTVYVRSNCGGGEYSLWSTGCNFKTLCSPITSYPYLESFGTYIVGLGTVLNPCWSVSEGASGASYHWQAANNTSNGASAPKDGGYFAYLNVYSASASYNPYYLTTPSFIFDSKPKQVSYWYYLGNDGNKTAPLTLQISVDGGVSWANIYQHNSTNSTFATSGAVSNWTLNTVDLSAYVNQTVILRFAANSNYGSGYCNQGIDEFTVEDKDFTNIATLPHDEKALSLYPNPVHDVLHLDGLTEPVAARVVDFSGRTVLIKQNVVESIDVSSLPAGIYLLQINTNEGVTIKKFIKQ